MLVCTSPGQATLTLTPSSEASARSPSEKPMMAHLVVLYADRIGPGMKPVTDETLMICPNPCRSMTR